jgi:chromosome segregation ATPase
VADAAALSSTDTQKLVALVQADDDASDPGAPAAAVYKSHGGDIISVLEDMREKSDSQLADLRKAETSSAHSYELVKQSLDDQIANDEKHMKQEKSAKAAAEQSKAEAEGDLERTVAELKSAEEKLEATHGSCMQASHDFESNVNSRAEELKVIAEAKKILLETSSGAVEQTYSFIQVSGRTQATLVRTKVVELVKKLATKHHSTALAQLASRIRAIAQHSSQNNIFGKVTELINAMISQLEKEGAADATEKAYCDEQMAKTEEKKADLEDTVAKLQGKIDQAEAKSAKLKAQVQTLGEELLELAKMQAEMDKVRQEEKAAYETAKADLELGISGVRKAHGVLSKYYGGEAFVQQPAAPSQFKKASGAGGSIIDILDVVLSDFEKDLADETATENAAAATYEKTTQENKIEKATKEKDVEYKSQEAKALDVSISELSSDADSASTELGAVNEYYAKVKERCIAKPETYADRKARREAEIAGLKEALKVLETETALVQRRFRGHRTLSHD